MKPLALFTLRRALYAQSAGGRRSVGPAHTGHGCDNNWGSALYFTIVGLFVVPGTRTDALFLANATLWDVRNEYLYASAEAEGTDHTTGTPLTVDDAQVMGSARLKGMATLGEEVDRRLKSLAGPARDH